MNPTNNILPWATTRLWEAVKTCPGNVFDHKSTHVQALVLIIDRLRLLLATCPRMAMAEMAVRRLSPSK